MKLFQKQAFPSLKRSLQQNLRRLALVAPAFVIFGQSSASADDWPQWQGPNRDAVSAEKGLLQQWPEGGPALAWRIENLGGGDSAPAVVGGKLYGMSNQNGKEVVWAIAEKDGSAVWSTPIGDAVEQRMPQSKEGPGGTPTVDGEHLYVIGMGGRVACLQIADGELVWERQLTDDFGGKVPPWSFRESALVDGDQADLHTGWSRSNDGRIKQEDRRNPMEDQLERGRNRQYRRQQSSRRRASPEGKPSPGRPTPTRSPATGFAT